MFNYQEEEIQIIALYNLNNIIINLYKNDAILTVTFIANKIMNYIQSNMSNFDLFTDIKKK